MLLFEPIELCACECLVFPSPCCSPPSPFSLLLPLPFLFSFFFSFPLLAVFIALQMATLASSHLHDLWLQRDNFDGTLCGHVEEGLGRGFHGARAVFRCINLYMFHLSLLMKGVCCPSVRFYVDWLGHFMLEHFLNRVKGVGKDMTSYKKTFATV